MAEERGHSAEGLNVLWAPWRMQYIEAPKADSCIFCILPDGSGLRSALILGVTPHARVMLNKYPYNNGHLLIAPLDHKARLDELTPQEHADIQQVIVQFVGLLERLMNAQGFNIGLNLGGVAGAGLPGHLHWHVTKSP